MAKKQATNLDPMDPESMGNTNVAIEDLGDGYVVRTSANKAGRLSYSLYVNGQMEMCGGKEGVLEVMALMRQGMTCNEANMHLVGMGR